MDSLLFYYSTKKTGYLKRDSLPIYLPLKMELNEGITRLAHFGKPQKKQVTLMDNLPYLHPRKDITRAILRIAEG